MACDITVGNLCESEQNMMLRASLIALTLGLAAAVVITRLEAPVIARAACFVPFLLSATWLFQALGKT